MEDDERHYHNDREEIQEEGDEDAGMNGLVDVSELHDLSAQAGRTLLPGPLAKAVSIATRSTSMALRMSTVVGGYGFEAAKVTTLSSLELGRGILEGILSRAGRDVMVRTRSELVKADAETILETSLESLHRTMTQIVFWTTTGFQMTGTTLGMVSDVSLLLLSTMDQFFGSTDSSRAIASIITLIRREFQNPATGRQGERVGVVDLVLGLSGMAYLQAWCRRLIDEETRRLEIEEVVWDVVVLDDGERLDVHEASLYRDDSAKAVADTIETHGLQDSDDDDDDEGLPEIRLKRQIMRSLPHDTRVAISTSIETTKTITVDVSGSQAVPLAPPPGVELIEESRTTTRPSNTATPSQPTAPTYRVVYRVNRNKERSTSFKKEGGVGQAGFVEHLSSDDEACPDVDDVSPPFTPQQLPPPPPKMAAASKASKTPSPIIFSRPGSSTQTRIPSASKTMAENAANQKRLRIPLATSTTANTRPTPPPPRKQSINRLLSRPKDDKTEKRGFRSALKKGTVSGLTSFLHKEDSGSDSSAKGKQKLVKKMVQNSKGSSPSSSSPRYGHLHVPNRSLAPKREAPHAPQRTPARSAVTPAKDVEDPFVRASSRASYISVHETRRDSLVSQTDTYSIHTSHTAEDSYRPLSSGSMVKSRSEKDICNTSPLRSHRRVKSQLYSPSIYTLKTNDSQLSLVPYGDKSAFSDTGALGTLRQAGMVDAMFPRFHLLRSITRYMRFASASYGSNFLKVMGISKQMPMLRALDDNTHHELRSFAHHTESDAGSILLSSFVDPQGGSDGTGSTNTGVPLVHYISLDHEAKAVVLACRGTLGFEDVLADMACDYDELVWRHHTYKVHKGVHASARRLLYGGDGRVLVTLRQALDEFTDYGLVLTGHSLGGAVTALLGVMLSEPAAAGTSFVTSSEAHRQDRGALSLPSGRPIHVFAYGPPSTMSASLCRATRGLITSIVNNNDLVPYLSLGVLHDFQAVALAFKTDNNEAKVEVRQRIWDAFQTGIADKWYNNNSSSTGGTSTQKDRPAHGPNSSQQANDDDKWAYAALKVLRASMMSQKLLPPGEVFVVETAQVLRRDAFLVDSVADYGRPARRVVLKYVRDVEKRFGEVRFGTSMLTDHSPGKYEDALNKLRAGVLGV